MTDDALDELRRVVERVSEAEIARRAEIAEELAYTEAGMRMEHYDERVADINEERAVDLVRLLVAARQVTMNGSA